MIYSLFIFFSLLFSCVLTSYNMLLSDKSDRNAQMYFDQYIYLNSRIDNTRDELSKELREYMNRTISIKIDEKFTALTRAKSGMRKNISF